MTPSRFRLAARGLGMALLAAGVLAACGRVPEQALRDEQARSRHYRDAYETQAAELAALRARISELEKGCAK